MEFNTDRRGALMGLGAGLVLSGLTQTGAANAVAGPRITTQASRVRVYVIPTDEERMIAEHTVKHVGQALLRH